MGENKYLVLLLFGILFNLSLKAHDIKSSEIDIDIDKISFFLPIDNKPQVKKYIARYMTARPEDIQSLVQRSYTYFPIIESLLAEQGLPLDLKYMPVVESELLEDAHSQASAVGLWQFVSNTASHFGLQINDNIDERLFAHQSTSAAIAYLSKLHSRYHDWGLTLLAYNYGPSRLNNKIEEVGSANLNTLLSHLPEETQNYVYKIMAAKYLFENYNALFPENAKTSIVDYTVSIVDFPENKSLEDILSHFPQHKALILNFNKHILNPDAKGLYTYLALPYGLDLELMTESPIIEEKHTLLPGQKLEDIQRFLGISLGYIHFWNSMDSSDRDSRSYKLFIPLHKLDAFRSIFGAHSVSDLPKVEYAAHSAAGQNILHANPVEQKRNFKPYIVKTHDTLSQIAFLHDCSISDLVQLNPQLENLRTGQVVNIPVDELDSISR